MKRSFSHRPALEALELRDCPAVIMGVIGSTLFVRGDAADNTIAITDNGTGGVSAEAEGRTVSGTGITHVLVDAGRGNDTVGYTMTGALAGNRLVLVDLGLGNDTGTLTAAGIASGNFLSQFQGNDGTDTLNANIGGIAAGARAAVEMNGGRGNDTVDVVFSGELDGVLALKGSGQDGTDTVTGNVTLAAGSTGVLDADVRGGKGDDRLTLNVTGNTSALAFYEATLDGDEGIDTWTATDNVRVRRAEIKA